MARFLRSAFKHGYSEEDILTALENPISVEERLKHVGESIAVVLGFAVSSIHLIEVMYEREHTTGEPIVFHAQKAPRGTVERYSGSWG